MDNINTSIKLLNKNIIQSRIDRLIDNYIIDYDIYIQNNTIYADINNPTPIVVVTDQDSLNKKINKAVYAIVFTQRGKFKSLNDFRITTAIHKIKYALDNDIPLYYYGTTMQATYLSLKNDIKLLKQNQKIKYPLKFKDEL